MQPNNNTPTSSSATTPTPAPATTPMNPGGDIVFKDKPKKNTGMIVGMIILAILAAGGIGFGVWAYLDGNQKTADLNNQISDLESELASNPGIDEPAIDEDTNSETSTVSYIYVGEWGLKIKIPEELKFISYEFKQHGGTNQISGSTITVSGTIGDSLSDFANLYVNNSALGAIARLSKDSYSDTEIDGSEEFKACGVDGSLVFSDDKYNFCYSHPQAVFSTDELQKTLETQSVDTIQQMLTNKDNYSRI